MQLKTKNKQYTLELIWIRMRNQYLTSKQEQIHNLLKRDL